jgi:hypothetical protein
VPINLRIPQLRNSVAWLETDPPAEATKVFTERNYQAVRCNEEDLRRADYIVGLAAVVFTQDSKKPLTVARYLSSHAANLLDYDCLPIVRPSAAKIADSVAFKLDEILATTLSTSAIPAAGLPAAELAVLEEPPLPHARYFARSIPWSDVANFVQTYTNRSAVNLALQIVVASPGEDCSVYEASMEPLIRRAFSDCSHVYLVPQKKGRSGADVFCVHAQFDGSRGEAVLGATTQPYFVKILGRSETVAEYKTYEQEVQPYVPFHLTPHLEARRCCIGASAGILISDFVSESEDLLRCASDGRATSGLACLFDRTLVGWHAQASEENKALSDPVLAKFPDSIETARLDRARELGAQLSLAQLADLFERCDSKPILVGPVHGDLHAKNVHIRGLDAIAIDFGSQRRAPLLFDAAKLEASLLVEMHFPDDIEVDHWLEVVRPLYESNLLACSSPTVSPGSWATWLYANVRQIRGYARRWQCGEHQYAGVLSLALLEKTRKNLDAKEPEASRRAAAYLLAELVLEKAFGLAQVSG